MAAREHAEVLQHNRFEQRSHQLVWRRPDFLQAVDIGFRKHSALARDFVQFDPVILLLGQKFRRNLQLRIDLVDNRAGTAGAFIVHRWNLLLAAALLVIFEDDDFCILPAQFNHGIHFWMKLLDGQRYGGDLLNKLRANLICNSVSTGPGHEDARVVAADASIAFHPL
jgi:hypothetical protein